MCRPRRPDALEAGVLEVVAGTCGLVLADLDGVVEIVIVWSGI
jgi:hypothetical protein